MTYAGDGSLMAGPECRPARYGLRSVADVTQDDSSEWQLGVQWDELACGYDPGIVLGQCNVEHHKSATRGFNNETADPFTMYSGWECSSGALPLGEAWDRVEELHRRNWWRTVERAFWTGLDQDGNDIRATLATADVTDLTPVDGALDITSGVAVLESFAGECFDCEPVVHGNKGITSYLAGRSLILPDGDQVRFVGTGSLWAGGGGYLQTGPDESGESGDALEGEGWLYVTGGVKITHTSTGFTPDKGDYAGSVDRLVNDITVYAENTVAIQIGCCVGAVLVTLSGCC
jgi:hypothetical protein